MQKSLVGDHQLDAPSHFICILNTYTNHGTIMHTEHNYCLASTCRNAASGNVNTMLMGNQMLLLATVEK